MALIQDLMITSLDEITGFTTGGEHRFTLDELSDASISNTQEKSEITGKAGRILGSIKRNKAVTVKGTNGMINIGLLETDTGTTASYGESTVVEWIDYLDIDVSESTATATLSYSAEGTAGAEIDTLYLKGADGVIKSKLTQSTSASEGKFALSGRQLTFDLSDVESGDACVVYYKRAVTATVAGNDSGTYSEVLRLYIDATAEDKCNNEYHVQFVIYKADFSGNFDITMGEQATHAFEATSLASSGCGSASGNGRYWDMIVFDESEQGR